jgi:hypothetical protein
MPQQFGKIWKFEVFTVIFCVYHSIKLKTREFKRAILLTLMTLPDLERVGLLGRPMYLRALGEKNVFK